MSGMDGVRAAFIEAADGKLRLDHAELEYKDSHQFLSFTGWRSDGSTFSIATEPFDGNPQLRAMQAARDLLTQQGITPPLVLTDKPQTTNTTQGLAQFDRSLARATSEINRSERMKDVLGLPDAVNEIVAALNASAKAAVDRLNKAKDGHGASVGRVNAVAEVIETATKKTDDFVASIMGGNGSPLSGS